MPCLWGVRGRSIRSVAFPWCFVGLLLTHRMKKYEEYSIPATRVGTLASGQRLIQVAEMDGLCQKTFKGYKALNRMQTLVYPVAYKTSENMLICAPTGAVSHATPPSQSYLTKDCGRS